ncbi:hypothetical protein [Pseudomonas sp. NPDC007930]|uniref:hypothetical protein n=1 Tax=Pseudomonas sp. NPDC007930 TaxID=3364417 RepID=UPI0036EF373D
MSRQPFATADVVDFNLALRKGLSILLAVLVTLVLCQQWQHWTAAPEPLIHTHHTTALPRLSAASAQAGVAQGRLQAAEVVDSIDRAPSEPRWVF